MPYAFAGRIDLHVTPGDRTSAGSSGSGGIACSNPFQLPVRNKSKPLAVGRKERIVCTFSTCEWFAIESIDGAQIQLQTRSADISEVAAVG
jgi:hypothetical protein